MRENNKVTALLDANERRAYLLDLLYCFIFLCSLFTMAWGAYIALRVVELSDIFLGNVVRSFGAGLFAVTAGYPVLLLLEQLRDWSIKRWAPTWVIEKGEEVIKVWGVVPIPELDSVRAQMLRGRPDYEPVLNAWEQYGCTIAAVRQAPGEGRPNRGAFA